MAKKDETVELPVHESPEVQRFIKAQQEYQQFKDNNPEFFAALSHLIDQYNNALEAASKAVETRGVTCGPFELACKPIIKWDAKKLYTEMGKTRFDELRLGTVEMAPVYTVNKEVAESARIMGKIPAEVVEETRTVSYRYHRPDKGSVL